MSIEDRLTSLESKCVELDNKVNDIRDNHLNDIWTAIEGVWGSIEFLFKDLKNLRSYIWGSAAIIAIVIALCQLLG